MKYSIHLDRVDIATVLANHYGVRPADVRLEGIEAQDDGPGRHTPATVIASITSAKPFDSRGGD